MVVWERRCVDVWMDLEGMGIKQSAQSSKTELNITVQKATETRH